MASEVTVSFIALVVALIALFVASAQLLQAIFSTATGYRRCQESTMGMWAVHTRLQWRWSLFGFETRYSTPEIRLWPLAPGTPTKARLFLLSRYSYEGHETYRNLVNILTARVDILEFWRSWASPLAIIPAIIMMPFWAYNAWIEHVMMKQNEPHRKWDWKDFKLWLLGSSSLVARYDDGDELDKITWPKLLDSITTLQTRQLYDDIAPFAHTITRSRAEDAFYLEVVNRCWDVQPAEVNVPLASIQSSNLIMLAHRFGMGWEQLDLHSGRMEARGTQGAISSRFARGLGVVVEFSSNTVPARGTIPRIEADGLGLGVLFLSELLGGINQDNTLRLCGDLSQDGRRMDTTDFTDALLDLDCEPSVIDALAETMADVERWKVPNGGYDVRAIVSDMTVLSLSFLGCSSPVRDILHPLRLRSFDSPLCTWEGRSALHHHLSSEVGHNQPASSTLKWALGALDNLTTNHADNFYEHSNKVDTSLLETLLKLYRTTDDYFYQTFGRGAQWPDASSPDGVSPYVLDLSTWRATFLPSLPAPEDGGMGTLQVAYSALLSAHITMAQKCSHDLSDGDVERFKKRAFGGDKRGPRTSYYMLELGHRYAEHVHDDIVRSPQVKGALNEKGRVEEAALDRLIREAWWMMVVRGIVWSMSVRIHPRCSSIPMVPSHYETFTKWVYIA